MSTRGRLQNTGEDVVVTELHGVMLVNLCTFSLKDALSKLATKHGAAL